MRKTEIRIEPGRMRPIGLERDVLTYTSGAETKGPPQIYAHTYGEPISTGGSEAFRGQAEQDISDMTFMLYFQSDVKAKDRVIYRGIRFNIVSVNSDEVMHQWTKLECKTVGA